MPRSQNQQQNRSWLWKFWNWGLNQNYQIWAHIIGLAIVYALTAYIVALPILNSVGICLILALLWEVYEYTFLMNCNPLNNYPSVEYWAWNTVGDVLAPMFNIFLMTIPLLG